MWIDYSSANENLSTKKGRMKCGRMPDYVHDTKLDTWFSRTHDYGRRSVWIRDNGRVWWQFYFTILNASFACGCFVNLTKLTFRHLRNFDQTLTLTNMPSLKLLVVDCYIFQGPTVPLGTCGWYQTVNFNLQSYSCEWHREVHPSIGSGHRNWTFVNYLREQSYGNR